MVVNVFVGISSSLSAWRVVRYPFGSSIGANRVKWVVSEVRMLRAVWQSSLAMGVCCARGFSSMTTDPSRLWWHRWVFFTSLITIAKIRHFFEICKKKNNYFHFGLHFFLRYSVTVLQLIFSLFSPLKYTLYLYIYINIKVIFCFYEGSQI